MSCSLLGTVTLESVAISVLSYNNLIKISTLYVDICSGWIGLVFVLVLCDGMGEEKLTISMSEWYTASLYSIAVDWNTLPCSSFSTL